MTLDKKKEEILQAKTAGEVLRWMQKNGGDEEVANYFNQLARKQFAEQYNDPDFLPSPHLVKRK